MNIDLKKIGSFALSNNLVLVAIGLAAFFVYQKCARTPADGLKPTQAPGVVTQAQTPKYVEKIIERNEIRYYPLSDHMTAAVLPKEKLEEAKPGSVAPDVKHDNNSQIVARAEIPPNRGKTQVDAIMNQDQDNVLRFRLDYRQLPPPFWDFKKEWHAGIGFGVAGPNQAEAWGKILPLRIGTVDTYAEGRVGMEREGGRFNGQITLGVQYDGQ